MQYPGFKQIINKPVHTEEVMKVEETKTATWWFREKKNWEKILPRETMLHVSMTQTSQLK